MSDDVPVIEHKQRSYAVKALRDLTPETTKQLKKAVYAGERWALEFVLNRTYPKSRPLPLNPHMSVTEMVNLIVSGELTIEEADTLCAIARQMKAMEQMDALSERVKALELARPV